MRYHDLLLGYKVAPNTTFPQSSSGSTMIHNILQQRVIPDDKGTGWIKCSAPYPRLAGDVIVRLAASLNGNNNDPCAHHHFIQPLLAERFFFTSAHDDRAFASSAGCASNETILFRSLGKKDPGFSHTEKFTKLRKRRGC